MRLQPFLLLYFHQEVFFRCVVCNLIRHNNDFWNLLHLTNTYRSRFANSSISRVSNMNKLIWSEELSAEAEMKLTCRSHRPVQLALLDSTYSHVNVARRRDRSGVLTSILRGWYNQRNLFLPGESACFPWSGCIDFMNMVNAKNTRMGCAYMQGCGMQNNSIILLCIYGGGGNQYMFDFKEGDACTGCSGNTSFCENNLCVACNASRNECECRKTCGKENVGMGQLDPATCTCSCQYGMGPNCDQPCANPENLHGLDVCAGVTQQDCQDPAIAEFCPENCTCSPMPTGI